MLLQAQSSRSGVGGGWDRQGIAAIRRRRRRVLSSPPVSSTVSHCTSPCACPHPTDGGYVILFLEGLVAVSAQGRDEKNVSI